MRRSRLFKHVPTAHSVKSNRYLKPFGRHLHHHFLWQFNRRGVAGGMAVGLFAGILIPFAQMLFGAIGAILFRVNLPVAVFATFATNPLTVPPLYYAAYKLGNMMMGGGNAGIPEIANKVASEQAEVGNWFVNSLEWLQSVGPQLMLGLAVIATVSAITGYVVVSVIWKWQARHRWHKRRLRQF